MPYCLDQTYKAHHNLAVSSQIIPSTQHPLVLAIHRCFVATKRSYHPRSHHPSPTPTPTPPTVQTMLPNTPHATSNRGGTEWYDVNWATPAGVEMCVATTILSREWRSDKPFRGSQALHKLAACEADYATDPRSSATPNFATPAPAQPAWSQPKTSYQPEPSVIVSLPHYSDRIRGPTPLRRRQPCARYPRPMRNLSHPTPFLAVAEMSARPVEIHYICITDPHPPHGIQSTLNPSAQTHQYLINTPLPFPNLVHHITHR